MARPRIHPVGSRNPGHLDALNLEEGMYAWGPIAGGTCGSRRTWRQIHGPHGSKPYGVLNYQHEWRGDMTPNLIRSLVMNLIAAALITWLLSQSKNPTIVKRTITAVAIGFAGFIFYPYSNFIWFKNPDIVAHMVDAIVPFALVGLLNHLFTPTS